VKCGLCDEIKDGCNAVFDDSLGLPPTVFDDSLGLPPTVFDDDSLGLPILVSPVAGVSVKKSCKICRGTSCPPDKPCKDKDFVGCSRPRCNRRGRCWCLEL